MTILHLRNQRIVVSRMTRVSGTPHGMALATLTGVNGNLQMLTPEKTAAVSGVYGKTFRFFTDAGADIVEGDQLKDESGVIYTVKKGGVTTWTQFGTTYMEILVLAS